jgi:hypothetical protein
MGTVVTSKPPFSASVADAFHDASDAVPVQFLVWPLRYRSRLRYAYK